MIAPYHRPDRLATVPALSRLASRAGFAPSQLVLPVFVADGATEPTPIPSLPSVMRHTLDSVAQVAAEAAQAGLGGLMVFGVPNPEDKDATGSAVLREDNILCRALQRIRAEVGDETAVMADTCLDEFTTHGHCGVLGADGQVDHAATVEIYAQQAVLQAQAGAHVVAPSGMMRGQVKAIRRALDASALTDVAILAYSAKFASAFYGPFRDAVASDYSGGPRPYQLDPTDRLAGWTHAEADARQGADLVMVKPAGYYLDVVSELATKSRVPVAAYQVSGEYAALKAAAANGWVDGAAVLRESVACIFRAGAEVVLTYGALELATALGGEL